MGRYPVNHDGTFDYGDIIYPTEIEAYKVPGMGTLKGNTEGKNRSLLNNFGENCRGAWGGSKIGFQKMKANLGKREKTKFGRATGPHSGSRGG